MGSTDLILFFSLTKTNSSEHLQEICIDEENAAPGLTSLPQRRAQTGQECQGWEQAFCLMVEPTYTQLGLKLNLVGFVVQPLLKCFCGYILGSLYLFCSL